MSDGGNFDEQQMKFRILFNRYKVSVYNYLYKITRSHETAEDITQEIFMRLWKNRDDLDRIENIGKYIFRMAHNESISFFRKLALDSKLANELKKTMPDIDNNVLAEVNKREADNLIQKALFGLSPQRKKVYLLSRIQGLRLEEIAVEMGLSTNTVKNHLVAALKQIREFFTHSRNEISIISVLLSIVPAFV